MDKGRYRIGTVILWLVASSSVAGDPLSPKAEIELLVPQAKAMIDAWHAVDPEPGDRKLHITYWSPSDRDPARNYRQRLQRIMEHIRSFYEREMVRVGFGKRTINLDYDSSGKLVIHVVKGRLPFKDYGKASGNAIRKECVPVLREAGINVAGETIVVFCNMSTWDPVKKTIVHNSPYYASGNPVNGTAWQTDSQLLDTLNLRNKRMMVHDGEYGHISLGKHNSIFIGGVCHELGHLLGMPHNRARRDESRLWGTALMGAGNRSYADELRGEGKGSFLTLAHALKLASHPQFTNSNKGLAAKSNARISGAKAVPATGYLEVTGQVSGSPPVYAVIGYLDPEGGGDYNALTAAAVPDQEGNFNILLRPLGKNLEAKVRLIACQVNGAASSYAGPHGALWSYVVKTDADGKLLSADKEKR